MNDTPGWASPGSAPSDDQEAGIPRPSRPVDGNGPAGSQWAPAQPPPGQWSPPGSPGSGPGAPPPAPGWGGMSQGPGWGRAPMAAKPGVIPLRPLGVFEILDGAVSTMRSYWRPVLGISLTVSVIAEIAIILIQRYLLPQPEAIDPNSVEALSEVADSTQASLIANAPAALITMIAVLFTTAVLTVVISRSVLGHPVTLSAAWAEARPRLLPLLGVTLLLSAMSVAIMAVGLLPGLLLGGTAGTALAFLGFIAAVVITLWLMVRFALATPALMLERQSVLVSLRRSAKLVRGSWWRTLGILALSYLMIIILTLVIAIPFLLIAITADSDSLREFLDSGGNNFGWPFLIVTGIGDVIIATLTYPFFAGVTALLYVDQRIRREALDLDLARAAGLPGYDTPKS